MSQNNIKQEIVLKQQRSVKDLLETRGLKSEMYAVLEKDTGTRLDLDSILEPGMEVVILPRIYGGA